MTKITFKGWEQNPDMVGVPEILDILENNRSRLRELANMILTVCGLLLSTSFVILFFLLTNAKSNMTWLVSAMIFATCASLTFSIVFSILSVNPQRPSEITTKIQLIDFLSLAYTREYKRIFISVIFLLISIGLFFTALIIFGIGVLNKSPYA